MLTGVGFVGLAAGGGMLWHAGALDEQAQVTHYVPELAGTAYADATVRQVMDMTTALDFSEEYTDPNSGIGAMSNALGLTPREAEVLYWVTEGKTNEDVAAILGTGLPAVKKHLGKVYDKLGVENRTAAAAAVRRRVAPGTAG